MFLYVFLLTILSSFGIHEAPIPKESPKLYISTNNGKSWEGFANGLPENLNVLSVIEHRGTLFLTSVGDGIYALEKSSDSWEKRNSGLPIKIDSRAIPLANSQGYDFFPTSISAQGDRIVLGSFNNGVYYSDDVGLSWQQASTNIDDVVGALLFTEDLLVAGTHTGIWESKDRGENWELRCETGFRINALAMHNNQLHVARQNGMGILLENDLEWSDLKTDWAIFQLQSHGDFLYITSAKGEVFRSKTGKDWESNKFAVKGIPAKTIPDALWNGLCPKLPEDQPLGLMIETSRGWIFSTRGGC